MPRPGASSRYPLDASGGVRRPIGKESDMQVQPYLFFDGRCDEALAFYKKALGAEVQMLMRWKDSPDKSMCTPDNADKVMHSQIKIGDTVAMASDGRNGGQPEFKGFALSVGVKDAAEVDRMFGALAEGGQVTMPLTETFFSPRFGMVADKFGVQWMLTVAN
jgi:PhnB protein